MSMSSGKPFVIYGLVQPVGVEPYPGEVRYVGFTSQQPPEKRFWNHLKTTAKRKTFLGKWLRELKQNKKKPGFVILERGSFLRREIWQYAECSWISKFPTRQLLNATRGGDGGLLDGPAGEATRRKISQVNREHLKFCREDPIIRQKAKISTKAHWTTKNREIASQRQKIRLASQTTRDKMSRSAKNRWSILENLEEKRQNAIAQMAKNKNRNKLSRAAKERWLDPVFRKKILESFRDPKSRARRSNSAKKRWAEARQCHN